VMASGHKCIPKVDSYNCDSQNARGTTTTCRAFTFAMATSDEYRNYLESCADLAAAACLELASAGLTADEPKAPEQNAPSAEPGRERARRAGA